MVVAQERLELASLVQDYQALKLRLGLVEFADQMAIAARLAVQTPPVSRRSAPLSPWSCWTSTRTPPPRRR